MSRAVVLYTLLACFFVADALTAEFIGTKIFSLERTLGMQPAGIRIFDYTLNFDLTAGVVFWPLVFVLTDIINEYFGRSGVRFISITAAIMIGYAFAVIGVAMGLEPASWWIERQINGETINMDVAFDLIFGQSAWIIVGSITAFLVAQMVDAFTFYFIKRATGERHIWLRATGSTFISQFIDSYIVLWIAFGLGANWPVERVLAVGTLNYVYKALAAIVVTPLIYLGHYVIEWFLGRELSAYLKQKAMEGVPWWRELSG